MVFVGRLVRLANKWNDDLDVGWIGNPPDNVTTEILFVFCRVVLSPARQVGADSRSVVVDSLSVRPHVLVKSMGY